MEQSQFDINISFKQLESLHPDLFTPEQQSFIANAINSLDIPTQQSRFDISALLLSEIGLGRSAVAGILLSPTTTLPDYSEKQVEQLFGQSTGRS